MVTEPKHRQQQDVDVRFLGSCAVFLLLNQHLAWPNFTAAIRGRFVLGVKLATLPAILSNALDIPWLGPGLIVAFVLVITLRGRRRSATKPLHRRFRMPKLERFRGEVPRRHRDLEI